MPEPHRHGLPGAMPEKFGQDISSTDGEPLPSAATRLSGDDPTQSYEELHRVARDLGYTVEEEYLPGGRNGDCDFQARRIRVEVSNDERQQVKTLCHELAHALMHGNFEAPRGLKEWEAESVAYIVCDSLGLDTSAYSFGYGATRSRTRSSQTTFSHRRTKNGSDLGFCPLTYRSMRRE